MRVPPIEIPYSNSWFNRSVSHRREASKTMQIIVEQAAGLPLKVSSRFAGDDRLLNADDRNLQPCNQDMNPTPIRLYQIGRDHQITTWTQLRYNSSQFSK